MKTTPTTETPTADLNDYHKARNERLVKKVSKQRPMSSEESMEQMKRIAQSSSRKAVTSGD
ncbi:MAG: hypothetical protein H7319_07445 [Spirosoma sp.]|nr:hypothetical protein [Spirosoma sp.]